MLRLTVSLRGVGVVALTVRPKPGSQQALMRRLWCASARSGACPPFSVAAAALVSAQRWCSTGPGNAHQQQSGAARGSSSTADAIDAAAVIRAAKWDAAAFEVRLGFNAGETPSEERVKRHYYILAKHYHPDAAGERDDGGGGGGGSSSSGETAARESTRAFQNIKEAYEQLKGGGAKGQSGGWSSSSSAGGFGRGYEYADDARRRSQMRLLSDGVLLFMFMTLAFIVLVSRHNKSRLHSRYLWHAVFIFFMIQLFPRLLATALLFAAHSTLLQANATLQEQAAVSLVVERSPDACVVRLEGIAAEARPSVVVQVQTSTPDADLSEAAAATSLSSTLTFDQGVTTFTLPVPRDARCVYHIKAVDQKRKMVLVDRTLPAQPAASGS